MNGNFRSGEYLIYSRIFNSKTRKRGNFSALKTSAIA